jgi:tight adherence protein B
MAGQRLETRVERLYIEIVLFAAVSLTCWSVASLIASAVTRYEQVYVEQASRTMTGMFLFMDPRRLFYLNLAVMLIVMLIALVLSQNPLVILASGAAGFWLPKLWLYGMRKRRLAKFEEQIVDTLAVMSSALRSGMSIIQAIELVEKEQDPPTCQEFGLVLREYKVGVHLEEALENLAARMTSDDLNLIVNAMNIVLDSGGKLTEMLDTLADVIRKRRKLEGKLKSLTAQGKLQALVVTLLPLGIGYMMYLMDPSMMMRMITDTIGNILFGIMFTLQIFGFLMIRKITSLEY